MSGIVSKEIHTHGTRDFNFAAYPHSLFDMYSLFFDAHWHDEWEILYVRDGVFQFFVNGQQFTVRKNQALLVDRYAIHAVSHYEPGNGSGYNCFVFGPRFLCPDSESYICRHSFSKFDSDSVCLTQRITGEKEYEREMLRHIRLLDEYSAEPKQNALQIQIALLSVFDILLREQAYVVKPCQLTEQNELIKTALLYINREYRNPIRIQSLAASMNISTDHFIRLFKSMMGLTPKQYIQNLRMQEATSLMRREPDLTISEIACRAGFDDVNYFSRCFRKVIGLSPTQYMKNKS